MSLYSIEDGQRNEQRGFGHSFADERPELTYVPDTGSDHPLEDQMEPTGSAIDSMTTAMKRAKARLLLVAPKGARINVEYCFRLDTFKDGTELIAGRWMVSAHFGDYGAMVQGCGDTLDDAVLRCVAALADRKPATPVTKAAGLERALADVLDDDYPDAEDRIDAEVAEAIEVRQSARESTGGDAAGLDRLLDAIAAA